MGIYKRLDDVPSQHRFHQFHAMYEGRDVWSEFKQANEMAFDSEHYHRTFEKAERSWKNHIADRGRHHALGTPRDVEAWCAQLVADRKLDTVYKEYWVRLEEFYRWLQWRCDHPHLYQPPLMAAANHEVSRSVWWTKMGEDSRALGGEADD
jgi:hypothetical protein